ncbi:MAG: redoxin domain-containing protein [Pseudomonadota bacterium]
MLLRSPSVLIALFFVSLAGTADAARVDNFVLLDQHGDAHELYYHKHADAVVLLTHQRSCGAVEQAASALSGYRREFEDTDLELFLLNADLRADRATLSAWSEAQKLNAPILHDETQLIAEALDLTQAGEIVVINPASWQISYRGPDAAAARRHIVALKAGTPLNALREPVGGCAIDLAQRAGDHAKISYSETIAPMLKDKCVVCHTEGGLGPWAMTDYNMVRGFAPMIREVVRTKRMPPWHADPHVGVWKNDISLSTEQTQQLVHWIEAGAPRGAGPDPLAESQVAHIEWPLGQPDLILDIPEYSVPASGVVDYQFPTVENPLETGVWVKAATVVPGDREVVHHILAGTSDATSPSARRDAGVFDNYLIGYAPGNESHKFPSDTGVYVPPGGVYMFQLHYTPVGRETVDRSKIGLYFHKETPDNFFRQGVVIDPTITIPPTEARHAEVAYFEFKDDSMLHDLVPHAHYRGVASKFELRKPDGSSEVVLSVPNYDFNWQRTYEFVEPKFIPAGSKLVHTTWYDNSADNPGNPDPSRAVPWGLQSWDEMLYGAFSYTIVDETTEAPILDKERTETAQFVGFLDKNIDGKLSWQELPKRIKKRLVQGFKVVDANGDGGLDIDEMHALTQRMNQTREKREASAADAR